MLTLFQAQATVASTPMYLATVAPHAIVVPIDLARDGRSGVAILDPLSGAVDFQRSSAFGKLQFGKRISDNAAKDAVAACALEGDVLLILTKAGKLELVEGMDKSKETPRGVLLGPSKTMLERLGAPLQMLSGRFRRGHEREALVIGPRGDAVLIERGQPRDLRWIMGSFPIGGRLNGYTWAGAAALSGVVDNIAWSDRSGAFWSTTISETESGGLRFAKPGRVASTPAVAAIGHLQRSDKGEAVGFSDPAADSNRSLDPLLQVFVDDMDGDKLDDVVFVRRSRGDLATKDVYVQFADSAKASKAADGLLDAWKDGSLKPGGLDLKALGCNAGHIDLIVEVQRMEDVPEDKVRSEMDRVVKYFASLPVANPDGTKGIYLHPIIREPIPSSDAGKPWWELGEKYHPANHRGITHWMVVSNGGGGQSGEMTDRGGCGLNAMYAVFTHEFGHQLGLDHTGRWSPAWCPIYPSMMNYAYSYQLNGKYNDICYSDGRLAGLTLDERHLDEYLPHPPEKVSFITGPPYHFRIKPAPDGKGTLVDWNWNGIFGEKNISADINYGYSTSGGLRHTIGKSYTAPAVIALGRTLLAFSGELPEGATVPVADATAKEPSLSLAQPGRIRVRAWKGTEPATEGDKWSDPFDLEPQGVTGDPSVTGLGSAIWISYPTAAGVVVRRVSFTASGHLDLGEAVTLAGPAGTQSTICAVGGKLILLLWHGAEANVTSRMGIVSGDRVTFEPETDLGFTSSAPVGAAEGESKRDGTTLWIGASKSQDASKPFRWQVRQFSVSNTTVKAVSEEWVGGVNGGERGPNRIALLWERSRSFPGGQIYLFGCGMNSKEAPWSCHYVCTRIADQTVNGGWLTRRYYDEWTTSRSGPGVCWFNGDIVFSSRWFGNVHGTENDNLFVAFFGRGIESEPMGDFNDIAFIRDVGLPRSIAFMGE